MKKIALFVEGQAELIFIREFLLKSFDYNPSEICLECYNLFGKDKMNNFKNIKAVEYPYPESQPLKNHNPSFYFRIYNVGMDNSVLEQIVENEQRLLAAEYNLLIGLRDMYSEQYRKINKSNKINPKVNQRFIERSQKDIQDRCQEPNRIRFNYAIMEMETWILGLKTIFLKIDNRLTDEYIKKKLGFSLEEVNPETAFYHPVKQLEKIFKIVGKKYDKKKSDLNVIMSHTEKEDFKTLYKSESCQSFNHFYQSLEIDTL